MWRIGQLARAAGVSAHTLRHYDRIGLLRPAAADPVTGYRWYGVAELSRLERIRGLQQLGLPLRRIADLIDAPGPQVDQAVAETVTHLRKDIAALSASLAAAEDRLATPTAVLPQQTTMGPRRLRVRYARINHPDELAGLCGSQATTLLTWLTGPPGGAFTAAVRADRGGDLLTLPARDVVRAMVPPGYTLVDAGRDLFAWLDRRALTVAGPTVEDHLTDADGATATVLEIPVLARAAYDPQVCARSH